MNASNSSKICDTDPENSFYQPITGQYALQLQYLVPWEHTLMGTVIDLVITKQFRYRSTNMGYKVYMISLFGLAQ